MYPFLTLIDSHLTLIGIMFLWDIAPAPGVPMQEQSQFRLLHGDDLHSIPADEFTLHKFQGEITDLVVGGELLGQRSETDRATADEPVVAEITEGNRLAAGYRIGHKFGDVHRLAKDGIIVAVPEVITIGILQLAKGKAVLSFMSHTAFLRYSGFTEKYCSMRLS